jgi:hypothetical protein
MHRLVSSGVLLAALAVPAAAEAPLPAIIHLADPAGVPATPPPVEVPGVPARPPRVEGVPATPTPEVPALSHDSIALAVNPPIRWATEEKAFAASVYVGVLARHAIRANVARYPFQPNLGGELVAIAAGAESEASYDGTVSDVGVGWMYFPRRRWDGPLIEVGLLYRKTEGSVEDWFADDELVETRTSTYAARGLLGWSWLLADHFFTSFSFGLACGTERGTETGSDPDSSMSVRVSNIDRRYLASEGFWRLGVVFDL